MKDRIDKDRVYRYISGLKKALSQVPTDIRKSSQYSLLVDAVIRYLKDAEYYFEKGDLETSLVTVAYAEGLADSLKYTGVVEIEWPKISDETKVFLAGTFDIIHPGHIELMRWASQFGKLYVVVSRDSNVLKVKGRTPVLPEHVRLNIVKSIKYVYEAVLGDEHDIFKPIEWIKPEVIILGPDQIVSEKKVIEETEKRLGYKPVVKRYPGKTEFANIKSSSDIIQKICMEYCEIFKGS